jgi:hypothetical protein
MHREIPTRGGRLQKLASVYFEGLADGLSLAIRKGRRSGAQRGVPENNFGQRFSWTPLAFTN